MVHRMDPNLAPSQETCSDPQALHWMDLRKDKCSLGSRQGSPQGNMKMHAATAKDILTTLIESGFLRIPVVTLPTWIEVECHCSSWFTATPLNEHNLLKATGQKSDCSGLTVHRLFDEHPEQLQHAITNGQLKFKNTLNADTGTGMVTCHHKRIHQKDLVITGILIFRAVHTHSLAPPMLPRDHPLSTNQALIDKVKV